MGCRGEYVYVFVRPSISEEKCVICILGASPPPPPTAHQTVSRSAVAKAFKVQARARLRRWCTAGCRHSDVFYV